MLLRSYVSDLLKKLISTDHHFLVSYEAHFYHFQPKFIFGPVGFCHVLLVDKAQMTFKDNLPVMILLSQAFKQYRCNNISVYIACYDFMSYMALYFFSDRSVESKLEILIVFGITMHNQHKGFPSAIKSIKKLWLCSYIKLRYDFRTSHMSSSNTMLLENLEGQCQISSETCMVRTC